MMDPNIATMATSDEDDTTCPNLPKSTRTICYFIQAIVGVILIVPSIIPGYGLIIGIILLLTSSLWVMKPSKLWKKLIEPVRFISFILLIGGIVLFFVTKQNIIVGNVCTGVAFGTSYLLFQELKNLLKIVFAVVTSHAIKTKVKVKL